MTSGHLACHDCKQTLHIGKVMHVPMTGQTDLAMVNLHRKIYQKCLRRLSQSIFQHRIEIIPEQDFDLRDWSGYDALRPIPTVAATIANARSIAVGPITLRIEPFEDLPP